jgi:hypothetical protein
MGQFKPMVKMMTTEPSVELKLKKGGSVKSMTKMKSGGTGSGHKKMADGGGAMSAIMGTPALVGRPAVNAPVRTPGKPSMSARRKAMAPKAKMPATPMMKKGGETEKEHKAEMTKMKGLEKELKSHESKPASKGHKGLKSGGMACATGGVTNGQGGYKKGGNVKKYAKGGLTGNGIINTENQGGKYRDTLMHTAEYTTKTSGKTGGVKKGNGGGYKDGGMTMVEKGGKMVPDFAADGKGKMKKGGMMGGGMMRGYATGGVALGNGGGYKMGGKASKKAYATGGTVDSGKPVAMPQGRKKPSTPVSINQLSGTFKSGGKVTPAQGRLQKMFAKENAPAMKAAKAQSNEVYSKFQKKMAEGGMAETEEKLFKELQKTKESNDLLYRFPEGKSIDDVLSGKGSRMKPMPMPKGEDRQYSDLLYRFPKGAKLPKGVEEALKGMGSITETEKSVTVSPAGKKRGGRAC